MDILWRKVSPRIQKNHHNIAQILIRGIMVLILGGLAAAIPKMDAFIGLVGAIFFSSLGEWMVFLLCVFKEVLSFAPRWNSFPTWFQPNFNSYSASFKLSGLLVPACIETVFLYPDKLGTGNWILIKNLFLGAFAVLAITTGSYVSIHDIINIYLWNIANFDTDTWYFAICSINTKMHQKRNISSYKIGVILFLSASFRYWLT